MTNRLGCTDRRGPIFMALDVACKAMRNSYENRDLLSGYRGGWLYVQDFPMRAHRGKRGDILMCL